MRKIVVSPFLRKQILVLIFYFFVAVVITYPAITTLSTRYIGGSTSDAYEAARNLWWVKHALQTGQSVVYQPALGYPEGFLGVTIWSHWLRFFPSLPLAFLLPLPAAFNLGILFTLMLNGWAMYWLMYHLYDKKYHTPALFAGLVFLAAPTIQGHLFEAHVGVIILWGVPLYICALLNWINTAKRQYLLLTILFFFLSSSGHILQTIYLLAPITILIFLWRAWQRAWFGAFRVLVASILGSLSVFIFLLPILGDILQTPAYADAGGTIRYSADVLAIASPSFEHPFFKQVLDYPREVLGINLGEGAAYIGILVGILVIIGIVKKSQARFWLLLGLVAWILSLGPLLKIYDTPLAIQINEYETLIPLPFALLQNLPGFAFVRTPARFDIALVFAVAIMAGYGVATVRERYTYTLLLRYGAVGLLMILIIWEYQIFGSFPTIDATLPDEVVALKDREDVRAVFNLPWENLLVAKDALHLQIGHEKPLIAGQVTRQTPVNPAKLNVLQETLDPSLLEQEGVDVIIFHKTHEGNIALEDVMDAIGTPYYEDNRIALFDAPPTDNRVTTFRSTRPNESETITTSTDIYSIYIDEPGWVDISGSFATDERDVVLMLNNKPLHTWNVTGAEDFAISIPIATQGYSTIRFELSPPCPVSVYETLECQSLELFPFEISNVIIGPIYNPIQFEDGIELGATSLPEHSNDRLSIRLWWRFSEERDENDIRFIHVIDESGNLVIQDDESFGERMPESEWSEQVRMDVAELPPGEYRVLTGWYRLPDATRYEVLTEVSGSENATIELGVFEIQD